jgi:uncharacterized membrane protein YeaQ/YmgE (transglycosylase-associated protein family)
MEKRNFYIAGSVGTTVGGLLPSVFGQDGLSIWSIIGGGVGGLLAIYLLYKFTK